MKELKLMSRNEFIQKLKQWLPRINFDKGTDFAAYELTPTIYNSENFEKFYNYYLDCYYELEPLVNMLKLLGSDVDERNNYVNAYISAILCEFGSESLYLHHGIAQSDLKMLILGIDPFEAESLLVRAANRGNYEAAHLLSLMYGDGFDKIKPDEELAAFYAAKAKKLPSDKLCKDIMDTHRIDLENTEKLQERAKTQDVQAMEALSVLYSTDHMVRQDMVKSVYYADQVQRITNPQINDKESATTYIKRTAREIKLWQDIKTTISDKNKTAEECGHAQSAFMWRLMNIIEQIPGENLKNQFREKYRLVHVDTNAQTQEKRQQNKEEIINSLIKMMKLEMAMECTKLGLDENYMRKICAETKLDADEMTRAMEASCYYMGGQENIINKVKKYQH